MARPAAPAPVPASGIVIAEFGGIRVGSATVWTPVGRFPLRGTQWIVTDRWQHRTATPRWARLAAVLGFFVVLVFSLLFLLVRRTVLDGHVEVTAVHGPLRHTGRVPVTDLSGVERVHAQVAYLRSLSAL